MAEEGVTADTLLRGRVRLYQPARGARMSLDPVLLAGFLAPPYGCFLDIGCGAGPLSFLLLARDPAATGAGVEIQPRLAALAGRGRDDNGWSARWQVVEGDVRTVAIPDAGFDLVATNPPYRTVESSPPSPDRERALAHHEIALRLDEWIAVAVRVLRPGGRIGVILPAARADELAMRLAAARVPPARTRFVHPRAGEPPSRVLVEARAGHPTDPVVESPLIVHEPDGSFTAQVRHMLGEPPGRRPG